MKFDVDSSRKLTEWMAAPRPAIFQGQDLRALSAELARMPLAGCVFLGCRMENVLAEAAAGVRCLLMPAVEGLPFDPFTPGLYSPAELFDQFDPVDPQGSYERCLDHRIYNSYLDPHTRKPRPADVDMVLMRRLHDGVNQALVLAGNKAGGQPGRQGPGAQPKRQHERCARCGAASRQRRYQHRIHQPAGIGRRGYEIYRFNRRKRRLDRLSPDRKL